MFKIGGLRPDYGRDDLRSWYDVLIQKVPEAEILADIPYNNPALITLPRKGEALIQWTHVKRSLGTVADELTAATLEGRRQVRRALECFKLVKEQLGDVYLLDLPSMIGVPGDAADHRGVRHLRRRREKRPEAARRGLPGPIRRRYPRTGEAGAELLAAPGLRYSVPVAGSAQGRKPADGRTVHFGQLCGTRGLPGHGGLPGDGRSGRTAAARAVRRKCSVRSLIG